MKRPSLDIDGKPLGAKRVCKCGAGADVSTTDIAVRSPDGRVIAVHGVMHCYLSERVA